MQNRRMTMALWTFLLLVMFGSLTHTAWLFSLREEGTVAGKVVGYLIAVSIDAGLVGVTYGVRQRRRENRPARFLYLAAVLTILVSVYANFVHAFARDVGQEMTRVAWEKVDPYRLLTSAVVSIPLPLLVLALAETVGDESSPSGEQNSPPVQRQRGGQMQAREPVSLDTLTLANRTRAANREEALQALVDFYHLNPEASHRQAAQAIGRSRSWVSASLKGLEETGQIQRDNGTVKIVETSAQENGADQMSSSKGQVGEGGNHEHAI